MTRFSLRVSLGLLLIVALSSTASAATVVSVRATPTYAWKPPSPDPTGLTYRSDTKKLLITDSEVEEIPALWRHRDLFIVSRKGSVRDSRNIRISSECEDIAWANASRSLFVVDDDSKAVYRVRSGKDGKIGTADDIARRVLDTTRFGSEDPEGLDVGDGGRTLFITDATGRRVYTVRRGPDARFGTRDDRIRSFRTKPLGLRDPEGVAYAPNRRHLFLVSSFDHVIVETNLSGKEIRRIDLSGTSIVAPSSIEIAPASNDPTKRHLYVTDRGKDNQADPSENDGWLFEFRITRS